MMQTLSDYITTITTNVSSIIDFITSIPGAVLTIVTIALFCFQLHILRKDTSPYPFITSIVGRIPNPSYTPSNEHPPVLKHYHYGPNILKGSTAESALNDIHFDLEVYDHRLFITESTNNCNSIYFSMFEGKKCLILNTSKDPLKFMFEFCSSEICLTNYGALLHNLSIVGAKIYFMDKRKPLVLNAGKQTNVSDIIYHKGDDTFYLCQLVDNLQNMFCVTDHQFIENQRQKLGNKNQQYLECNFLNTVTNNDVFNYTQIAIYTKCKNIYGKTFYFKISVKKHGNYFIPNTKRCNGPLTKLAFRLHRKRVHFK